MEYTLKNDSIIAVFQDKGAELISLKKQGKEYIWCGDSAYWNRHSPVLFPVVGSFKNKEYHYKGTTYKMGQHGFARDMDFKLVAQSMDSIMFELTDTHETRKVYPFHFKLQIIYKLLKDTLEVTWKVTNTGKKSLYFSIGGHPAFLCPWDGAGKQEDYSLLLKKKGNAVNTIKVEYLQEGVVGKITKLMDTPNGYLPLTSGLFDQDALILEPKQVDEVSLVDGDKKPYVTVSFDAPVAGLWSPAKLNAPFVCIEPWFGRADRKEFKGELKEREWGNKLRADEVFAKHYTISL